MRSPNKTFRPCSYAAMGGLLAVLLACGGKAAGDGTTAAAPSAGTLSYTAPATAGFQLVRDPSSTRTHVVLNLVGPQGTQLKGVGLSLTVDGAKASWAKVGGTDPYLLEGSALTLGTGTKLVKSQLAGQTLEAAVYQKGATAPATLGTQAILTVALDLKAGAPRGPVTLSSASATLLDAAGKTQTIAVAVGSLTVE